MRANTLLYLFVSVIIFPLTGCEPEPVDNRQIKFSTNLSFSSNPGGYWQVGYSTGNVLDVSQFALCTFQDTSHIIRIWHPATGQASYYPYTGQNTTSTLQVDTTHSWAARPGEIVMEGSNIGQYSMLKFTAPAGGKYKIKVVFEGVHSGLSTTDVHVLINAQSLFSDNIDGYGGDSTFHAIQGPHPSTTYSDTLSLQKNDVITFAVGRGTDGTNYYDTTGLLIYLEFIG